MGGHEDDRVVIPAPPVPPGHKGGSTETDGAFRSPLARKAPGLKETAVVASAALKMRERASKTRQIATLKSKSKEGSAKKERLSLRAEDISFVPTYGSLESIQVRQARVRVRVDRARRRAAASKKGDEKKLNLTLRMMLGVRVAVGRQAAEPALQKLEDDDFTQTDQYAFPPAGTSGRLPTPSHDLNKTFKFKDYAPKAFKNLRSMFGIDELSYSMSVAGVYDYLELITNSKSGSFFFFSHDQKYIIKSMKRSEAKFFRRILPKYYEHQRQNPDSLLVRFCGMYMVKSDGKKIPFLVMTCIDGQALLRIHTKYDLKGSSWHRRAKDGDKVLKDNNLREADGKFRFGSQKEATLKALQADAQFLRDVNVMDYSVYMSVHDSSRPTAPIDRRELLRRQSSAFFVFADNEPPFRRISQFEDVQEEGGEEKSAETTGEKEHPPISSRHRQIQFRPDGGIESEGDGPREIYWIGIIDVLTEFTVLRQLEAWYKSIGRGGSTVSCVEPGLYCERFVNFMTERTV